MPSGNETVTVIRKPKVDKLSTAAQGAPLEFDLEDCQILPRQAEEDGRGWVTIDGWDIWCFTDPGREVLFSDQVRVRGVVYAVEGRPARYDKRGTFKALLVKAMRAG